MKILKWALALMGVVGLIVGGYLLFRFALDSRELIGAAQRYDSARAIKDPIVDAAIIAGVALATGVIFGLGLGLPSRTSGQVRRAVLEETNAAGSSAITRSAAERAVLPGEPQPPVVG